MNIKGKLIKKIVSLNPKRFSFLSDEQYLQLKFYDAFGRFMDFSNPQTFNEKLQWLKIHDHKPEYTMMVDKYKSKEYVGNIIGGKYIIPTIGVWDNFEEIDFDALPNQFVLKCTHDSGGLVVCRDKAKLDLDATRKKIETSLLNNFYYMGREWPYKNVPHKIIAEQFMSDNLRDHKLFGSDSVPRMILVYSQRFTKEGVKEEFYDEVWSCLNAQRFTGGNPIFPIQRRKQYKMIKQLARELYEKTSCARIDFYEINENKYFAEMTFDSVCDMDKINPDMWNSKFEEMTGLFLNGCELNLNEYSVIFSNSYYNSNVEKAINDYKIFCFNGKIDSIMVCTGREKGHPDFYFYDRNWNRLYYQHDFLEKKNNIDKPRNLDEMIQLAEILCKGHNHIRVDLFDVDDNIYFGELTFFDNSGFDTDISYETDLKWGKQIVLPYQ